MPAELRPEPATDAFVDRLGPIGARLLSERDRVGHLRAVPAGQPPWPRPGHPMLAWLVADAARAAREDGVRAALPPLGVHAWREGGLAWELSVVEPQAPTDPAVWPGQPTEQIEPHVRAHLAGEPPSVRSLRAQRPPATPWPRDGDVLLEHLVVEAAERLGGGADGGDVLLWLAMHAWREGGVARAAVRLGPPPPPPAPAVSATGR